MNPGHCGRVKVLLRDFPGHCESHLFYLKINSAERDNMTRHCAGGLRALVSKNA